MKKRLLSILLTLAMFISMLPAMSITASAAALKMNFVGDTAEIVLFEHKLSTENEINNVKDIKISEGSESIISNLKTENSEAGLVCSFKCLAAGTAKIEYKQYNGYEWIDAAQSNITVQPVVTVGETCTVKLSSMILGENDDNIRNITTSDSTIATVQSATQNGNDIDVVVKGIADGTVYFEYELNNSGDWSTKNTKRFQQLRVETQCAATVVETGTLYGTLQSAINDAQNTQTVKLLKDVTENVSIPEGKTVSLDLNGYVLKAKDAGSVITDNGNLTVTDSNTGSLTHNFKVEKVDNSYKWTRTDDDATVAYANLSSIPTEGTVVAVSGGCITGGTYSGIRVGNGAALTLAGGSIVGNRASAGGGVYNEGSMTVTGGRIIGNLGSENNAGGGVYVAGGASLEISGGTIGFNCAGSRAGGVYSEGTITMTGGSISYNSSQYGFSGVYATKGTFDFSGGEISHNVTAGYGIVGIGSNFSDTPNPCVFTMTGTAKINNNTASSGSALSLQPYGTANLLGGEIRYNKSTESYSTTECCAVCIGSTNFNLTLGGSIRITDNTNGADSPANLLLNGNQASCPTVNVATGTNALVAGTAQIGVTIHITKGFSGVTGEGFVTAKADADYRGFFTSDEDYAVITAGTGANRQVKLIDVAAEITDGDNQGKTYNSLQAAITDCPNGVKTTVKLLKKAVESVTVESEKNIVLDLNGKTLTSGQDQTLTTYGTLEITDSSAAKTGKIVGTNNMGIKVADGSARLTGGTVEAPYAIAVIGGTLTVTDGTYTGSSGSIFTSAGKVNLQGGRYSGGFYKYGGSITISGGCFDSAAYGSSGFNSYIASGLLFETCEHGNTGYKDVCAPAAAKYNNTKYNTVQAAINAVGSNGTGTIQMLSDSTENIEIPADCIITLDLNGHILKGTGAGSVITNKGKLTIKDSNSENLTHNFKVGENGLWTLTDDTKTTTLSELTARPATGAVIELTGGCITGGNATSLDQTERGGGICNSMGGTLTFSGGNIVGNRTNYGGGGVYNFGDSYNNDTIFTMTGGNIVGNITDDDTFGGGVCNEGTGSETADAIFELKGGFVSYNTSGGMGGGVVSASSIFRMTGGTVSGNKAANGGGAAIGLCAAEISAGSITNNEATASGGGIYIFGFVGAVSMGGGTVSGNRASIGGGVYRDAFIGDCTFGGTANVTGNTLSDGTTASNVYLKSGQTAGIGNGAIEGPEDYDHNGVAFPVTSGNDAMKIGVTLQDGSGYVTGEISNDYSARFTSDNDKYTVKFNSTASCVELIADNVAATTNGKTEYYSSIADALKHGDDAALVPEGETKASPTVIKLLADVTENITIPADRYITLDLNGYVLKAKDAGSVIKVANSGKLTVKDSASEKTTRYFTDSDKDGCFETLEESYDTDGKTLGKDYIKTVGGVITGGKASSGGAIYADSYSNLTLDGINIVGNIAESNGGAVCSACNMTVKDCVIEGNLSIGYGGAIDCAELSSVTGSKLSYNTAHKEGGAIYSTNSSATSITGTEFIGNRVINESETEPLASGGAMNIYPKNATITDCTINDNYVYSKYGTAQFAALASSSLTIKNTTVSGNKAEGKDATTIIQAGASESGAVSIESCTVSDNKLIGESSSEILIYIVNGVNGNAVIKSSAIKDNTATCSGTAVATAGIRTPNHSGSKLALEGDLIFSGNTFCDIYNIYTLDLSKLSSVKDADGKTAKLAYYYEGKITQGFDTTLSTVAEKDASVYVTAVNPEVYILNKTTEGGSQVHLLSRILEQPSKSNSYTFKLYTEDLKASDVSYQWYKQNGTFLTEKDNAITLSVGTWDGTAVTGKFMGKGGTIIDLTTDEAFLYMYDPDGNYYSTRVGAEETVEGHSGVYKVTPDNKQIKVNASKVRFSKELVTESAVSGSTASALSASSAGDYRCIAKVKGTDIASNYAKLDHIHAWTYAVGGTGKENTLLAYCTANGCTGTAVSAATAQTLTVSIPALTTYGGTGSEKATLSGTTLGGLTVSADNIKYYQKTGDSYGTTSLSAAPTAAGTYKAVFTVNDGTKDISIYVEYTIAKAASSVSTAPTAVQSLSYTGNAQNLVSGGNAENGTLKYALGTNAATAPAASAFTSSVPTAANAGTYYVWYKCAGNENYADTAPECVTVTVAQKSIANAVITLDGNVFYEDGSTHTQAIKSVVSDGLNVSYDVKDNSDKASTAGAHTLTIVGSGNYTGTASKQFVILAKPEAEDSGKEIKVGSGKASIEVKNAENTLKTELAMTKTEAIAAAADPDDILLVNNGKTLDIWMEINPVDTENKDAAEVIEAIEAKAAADKGFDKETDKLVYVDVDLYKQFSDEAEPTAITETNAPLKVTITIPEELRDANASYSIIRYHYFEETGETAVEVIPCSRLENGTVTFESKLFCEIAILVQKNIICGMSITGDSEARHTDVKTYSVSFAGERPEGSQVLWTVRGKCAVVSGYIGDSITVMCDDTGSFTLIARLVDANGDTIRNADGKAISSSITVDVKVKTGDFINIIMDTIMNIFNKLFGWIRFW